MTIYLGMLHLAFFHIVYILEKSKQHIILNRSVFSDIELAHMQERLSHCTRLFTVFPLYFLINGNCFTSFLQFDFSEVDTVFPVQFTTIILPLS
jgi:hypothetical protein